MLRLRNVSYVWIAAVSIVAAGCASIMHGSRQSIAVTSTPPDAQVWVDGEANGKTPLTLSLQRKKASTIRIELPGYKPHELKLKRGIDGWFWVDILLTSPLAVIIDASTGAMYKLSPGKVGATLPKAAAGAGRDSLQIAVVLEADPTWIKIGQIERLDRAVSR